MIVIGYGKLESFWTSHSNAKAPLLRWYDLTMDADWKSLLDVRQSFRHADAVCDCVVFNVHGNHYRLISKIDFQAGILDVRFILTHPEYDRGRWKHDCC